MENIGYRIDYSGKIRTGLNAKPLIVEVDVLNERTLSWIPEYLIENIEKLDLLEGEKEKFSYDVRGTFIEVNGEFVLSDTTIWRLLLENNSKVKTHIFQYLDMIYTRYSNDSHYRLPWTSDVELLGQSVFRSFYEYLDWEGAPFSEKSEDVSIKINQLFEKYFSTWDLDSETSELDWCVTESLKASRAAGDLKTYLRILIRRLFMGQCDSLMSGYRYVKSKVHINIDGKSVFLELIKALRNNRDSGDAAYEFNYSNVYILCSAIYGSNKKEINEVAEFVKGSALSDEDYSSVGMRVYSDLIAVYELQADQNLKDSIWRKRTISTGFHEYDYSSNRYINISGNS